MPWLLNFTDPNPANVNGALGDGRPWADGTQMAGRIRQAPPAVPWDANCRVTTYIDGLSAMRAMRNALEAVIAAANVANAAGGQFAWRGHVYIAGWRFNCMRDLSENNWGTNPWPVPAPAANVTDQTAMGLVVRLLQAGVMVRIMVWLPTPMARDRVIGAAHVEDHFLAARIVKYESNRLTPPGGAPLPPGVAGPGVPVPLGVVALDLRTAAITFPAASHHQKMMVIRSPATNVAFVGGVDLAYTRRSGFTPPTPPSGDWQSGQTIPQNPAQWWPRQAPPAPPVDYQFLGDPALAQPAWAPALPAQAPVPAINAVQAADLPCAPPPGVNVYGNSIVPGFRQIWHDQHLMLEGPIVATIEEQFKERWEDQADRDWLGNAKLRSDVDNAADWASGQVIFSTAAAYNAGQIVQLPAVARPVPAVPAMPPVLAGWPGPWPPVLPAVSNVQMWRTIPLRNRTAQVPPPPGPPPRFTRGEFTVMAGIANAVEQARELIWMFDQYFWSEPLARLLNTQLRTWQSLHLILILPPYADGSPGAQHKARQDALTLLTDGLPRNPATNALTQVGVYNMWYGQWLAAGYAANRGIYVHAKSHTYDDALLVCGSANLARRSFLCDTELACAVEDPAVVNAHQQRLWAQLFPGGVAWPGATNLTTGAGGGAAFFTAFQNAAATAANSLLIPDPWETRLPLPNNVTRTADRMLPEYTGALDPSSVTLTIESTRVADPNFPVLGRLPNLADIVTRLERTPAGLFGLGNWPWRRIT
jgi:phosphatidylserine/phosphatidylglycerophosphate/cardiolipin synthase-like enzyme